MDLRRPLRFLAVLFFALAAPALAVTGDAPARDTFNTTFTPQHEVGSYTGVLKFSIAPGGVVSGYYRNEDVGGWVPVTGGLDGDRIHLDFDWNGRAHIEGIYDGKTIAGGTFVGGIIYNFVASPLPL